MPRLRSMRRGASGRQGVSYIVAALILMGTGCSSVASSQALASSDPDLPHEDLELEAKLPDMVAGGPLGSWSVRGQEVFVQLGVTDSQLVDEYKNLSDQGLSFDDVSMAVDYRTVPTDPPYRVIVFRFKGMPADQLATRLHGLGLGANRPNAGTFTLITLAGKQVFQGTLAMNDQTDHVRGLPYVYNIGELRYMIITDDPAWATDVLRQLP